MVSRKSARQKRKRSGRWSIACPPNWPLNDVEILREVDGELGPMLLLACYNVRLAAEADPDLRPSLFGRRIAVDATRCAPLEILEASEVLARLVSSRGDVPDRELADACRAIAEWAEAHSRSITAIAYAEAAARLLPDDPEMANLAGRACRRGGERQRAELWYERGAGLARRVGNTLEQVNGWLGFGNLYRDEGDFGRAFVWIRRAGRTARRGGLRESAGEALHDAFFVSYLNENLPRAAVWAERAARIYPVHADRLP